MNTPFNFAAQLHVLVHNRVDSDEHYAFSDTDNVAIRELIPLIRVQIELNDHKHSANVMQQ